MPLPKSILFVCLILLSLSGIAGDKNHTPSSLRVSGVVFRNNPLNGDKEMLAGVSVTLKTGDSLVSASLSGAKGNFDVLVRLNHQYILYFYKTGMAEKSVVIDTRHIPLAFRGYSYEFSPLNIELLPQIESMDYAVLNEPVTRIKYNINKSSFDYDVTYTKSHKSSIDSLFAQLQIIHKDKDKTGKQSTQNDKDVRENDTLSAADEIIRKAKEEAGKILEEARLIANAGREENKSSTHASASKSFVVSSDKILAQKQEQLKIQMKKLEMMKEHALQTVNPVDSEALAKKEAAIKSAEMLIQNADREIELLIRQSELQQMKLKNSRYLLTAFGGLFILLLIIALLLLKRNKLKSEQRALLLQNRIFRSQMNPHFIFNSLNSIQNFLLKNDEKQSTKYLANFSNLIRMILENSREELITLDREIQIIEQYISLQMLRFKDKFTYSIHVSPTIDQMSILIPPMLIQPFIENAIEHGIAQMDGKGEINIEFRSVNGFLEISISDNGIGRKRAEQSKSLDEQKHRSLATELTLERIALLNKQKGNKIDFSIEDLHKRGGESSGTRVSFKLKLS